MANILEPIKKYKLKCWLANLLHHGPLKTTLGAACGPWLGCSLHLQESGPEFFQGRGGVITSPTLLGPWSCIGVESSRTRAGLEPIRPIASIGPRAWEDPRYANEPTQADTLHRSCLCSGGAGPTVF